MFLFDFNSIKVRLKQEPCGFIIYHPDNFNSIKVRLKRYNRRGVLSHALFQFHKGTIKTARVSSKPIGTDISIP